MVEWPSMVKSTTLDSQSQTKVPDFNQNSPEVTAEVTGPKVLFEAKLVAAVDPAEGFKEGD